MKESETLLIGITGGIGTGQTTVAKLFEKFGAHLINADQVGHYLLNNDEEVKEAVLRVFGKKVFDQNQHINRKELGKIVFGDESQLQRLNRIMHPIMVTHIIEAIEKARSGGKFPMVVLDAALIYEIQMEQLFDAVVVVSARTNLRIERVSARDEVDEVEVRNRMNRQIPITDKIKWADFVIHNNGDLASLEDKTRKIYNRILGRIKSAETRPQKRRRGPSRRGGRPDNAAKK